MQEAEKGYENAAEAKRGPNWCRECGWLIVGWSEVRLAVAEVGEERRRVEGDGEAKVKQWTSEGNPP